jgi:hypothetical protein
MFMWMLIEVWVINEFEWRKYLCEWYTWSLQWWIMKEFELKKCLCECYMKFGVMNNERVWVEKMFM